MFRLPANILSLSRFRRDDRGATAIEFALVSPILIFALLSIVEICVLGMMTMGVNAAVQEASRRIRTGRADAAASAQGFKDQICGHLTGSLSQCRDRMTISVARYTRFSDANTAIAAAPDGAFNKGGPGDIIIVKVNYSWPMLTPVLRDVERDGPTHVIIPARVAFKNEPFG
jgi:Flp pilus assembly protein TadG